MPKSKSLSRLVALFLLAAAGSLQAAVVQVKGTPSNPGAIDTLTVSDVGGLANVAVVTNTITFLPGPNAQATRNRILDSLTAKGVPNSAQGFEQFRVDQTSGATPVNSVKLNSVEVPYSPAFVTGLSGQKYFRVPGDNNKAGRIPALTPLGLAVLTLLLVGAALWLFRKRNLRSA